MRLCLVPPDPCTKVSSRACPSPTILPGPDDVLSFIPWSRPRTRERFGEERLRGGSEGAVSPWRHGSLGWPGPLRPELHERGLPSQGQDPRSRRALQHTETQEPRRATPLPLTSCALGLLLGTPDPAGRRLDLDVCVLRGHAGRTLVVRAPDAAR